jgi:predicted ATPase with chaperone activity
MTEVVGQMLFQHPPFFLFSANLCLCTLLQPAARAVQSPRTQKRLAKRTGGPAAAIC